VINSILKETIRRHPKIEMIASRLLSLIPLSKRMGKDFWKWYSLFEESEHWSLDQLRDYQIECLRKLLPELIRTSEFYRRRLSDFDYDKFSTIEEFQTNIPALSRKEFRDNYEHIRSSEWNKRRRVAARTSGTTGMALQFVNPEEDRSREWAAICHQWKRVGYIPGKSRRAEFRGLTAPGKLVEVYPHLEMMRCSILHLKEEHAHYYADLIRKHDIDFFHGYPSALYLLAIQICKAGIDFPQPKALLLASESVCDWQLSQIKLAFPDSKIFAHYGCAEHTVMAGWCEFRQEYHVLPQYSLVEVDDKTSEVIGTNLFNDINGFVRYRMTDTVLEIKREVCPDCKRHYLPRFISLGGRIEEYLYSPKNGWLPPAIVTYPLKTLRAIQELQFIQREKREIVVNYTIRRNGDLAVEQELLQLEAGLLSLFGEEMKFYFIRVDDFLREPSGKFKWIICEMKDEAQGDRS
jgi:phenylacetate-CoA ligase